MKMKKIFEYSVLLALCSAFAAFAGCRREDLNTDPYGEGVRFVAFSPNPALRGDTLSILGSNLQDVLEVRFSGGVTISDYKVVKSGKYSEIRLMIPLEGPESGKITIVDKDGKEHSSFSSLTFYKKEYVVWEGELYTGPEGNLEIGAEDAWVKAGLEEGSEIRIYFSADSETDWQIQLCDGHWNKLSELGKGGDGNLFDSWNTPSAFGKGYINFTATKPIFDKLTTTGKGWGSALVVLGKGVTVKKITFQ